MFKRSLKTMWREAKSLMRLLEQVNKRIIKLTQGQCAIIDAEDYDRVAALAWHAHKEPGYSKTTFVALHSLPRRQGRTRSISMHRFILDAPPNNLIDHRNGNPLDNRKENLRLATKRTNGQNRGPAKSNKTGFKGVSIRRNEKRLKMYRANIRVNDKQVFLGNFMRPEEAALAYDRAAIEHFGEFAVLNFPHQ
jgi:hypothetical protein